MSYYVAPKINTAREVRSMRGRLLQVDSEAFVRDVLRDDPVSTKNIKQGSDDITIEGLGSFGLFPNENKGEGVTLSAVLGSKEREELALSLLNKFEKSAEPSVKLYAQHMAHIINTSKSLTDSLARAINKYQAVCMKDGSDCSKAFVSYVMAMIIVLQNGSTHNDSLPSEERLVQPCI